MKLSNEQKCDIFENLREDPYWKAYIQILGEILEKERINNENYEGKPNIPLNKIHEQRAENRGVIKNLRRVIGLQDKFKRQESKDTTQKS
jgi:hypothetical protein